MNAIKKCLKDADEDDLTWNKATLLSPEDAVVDIAALRAQDGGELLIQGSGRSSVCRRYSCTAGSSVPTMANTLWMVIAAESEPKSRTVLGTSSDAHVAADL